MIPISNETQRMVVSGIEISVLRKAIKNLHLAVCPPDGWVRVAAPLSVSDDAVRMAVICRLGWIRRQKAKYAEQPRQTKREMVSGESHFFLGKRYRLRVIEQVGVGKVVVGRSGMLELYVRPGADVEERAQVLKRFYREQLKALLPGILETWQKVLGVRALDWGVKRMKTKWGTCSAGAGRIWINLELIKTPMPCIEYVVVHELVHLMERHHGERFQALMDRYLPNWRLRRRELNGVPLAHEVWQADCFL